MPLPFSQILRDFVTDGIPSSGNNKPSKSELRSWGTWVESILNAIGVNAGLIYQTRAALFADLAKSANSMAWVTNDPTVAYNGVYQKIGGTGTGSWTRLADLPYSFIRATDAGAGTPDAIQATSGIPISESALVILNIFDTNIGSPVTVSFNGNTPLTVKTNSGNDIIPGGLPSGMMTLAIVSGANLRLVTDIDVSAAVAAAEAAAADAEAAKDAAEIAAGSLLFRIYPTIGDAEAATIDPTATYIAIASFMPQPRFYKQESSDPGAVDKLQSANLLWFKGLPLPPTALDFANAVARSANATLVAGDLDQVHIWTIGTGTTYTATLPDPDTYIGRLLHLEVSASSRGLLAFSCPDPIGKFTATELVIWGGESLTLLATAGRWEIIGGVCKPLSLFATNPGADIAATWVANSGWTTTQQGGEEWAINTGQVQAPRSGYYTSNFKVGAKWAAAPTFIYSVSNNNGGLAIHRNQQNTPAGANTLLPSSRDQVLARGAAITPVVIWSGGTTVAVERATFGAPELSLKEMPQW